MNALIFNVMIFLALVLAYTTAIILVLFSITSKIAEWLPGPTFSFNLPEIIIISMETRLFDPNQKEATRTCEADGF